MNTYYHTAITGLLLTYTATKENDGDAISKFFNFNPSSKSTLPHIIRGNYKNIELIQLEDIFDLNYETYDTKDDENENARIEILSQEMDGNHSEENTNENHLNSDYELENNLSIGALVQQLRDDEKEHRKRM